MWVQGDYLYWRDSANTRWRFLGTSVATPSGAKQGSLWIEANTVHYIDETAGVERYVDGPAIGASSPAGKAGSIWIDDAHPASSANGQLHFLGDTGHEFWSHNDVAASASHTDTPASTSHTDTPGSFGHTDAQPYNNSHSNSYSNSHNDNHTDNPNHNDAFEPLGHYDFTDNYYGHADAHSDEVTGNSHTDYYDPYSNSHTNVPYVNSHTDVPYSNSHTDVPHTDKPTTI